VSPEVNSPWQVPHVGPTPSAAARGFPASISFVVPSSYGGISSARRSYPGGLGRSGFPRGFVTTTPSFLARASLPEVVVRVIKCIRWGMLLADSHLSSFLSACFVWVTLSIHCLYLMLFFCCGRCMAGVVGCACFSSGTNFLILITNWIFPVFCWLLLCLALT
jgi:hypothetical protein